MFERVSGRFIGLGALVCLLMLTACATPPKDPEARAEFEAENDPIEPVNRAIFGFNEVIDGTLLKPAALIYRGVVPEEGRTGIRHVLNNLRSPFDITNDALQGNVDQAGDDLIRFLLNSTIGVFGIFDVATGWGYPYHSEDFGQTFATWGIGEGPYIVLPILGPSNPRDATGLGLEWVSDPFNLWMSNTDRDWAVWTRTVVNGVDLRSRNIETIDELQKTSIDFYAAVRSLYRQRRAEEIRDSGPASSPRAPTPTEGRSPDTGTAGSSNAQ
jgi:phospholipid-binding lipoprotein MlaA